ncbi:helix-hairpin-helix domain-containing protein, partial [Streptomyces sp. NPDC127044]
MSTEPETTEEVEPGTPGAGATADPQDVDTDTDTDTDTAAVTDAVEGEDAVEGGAETDGTADAAKLSEAAAELAAQRLERERIERRKAEKQGPIAAGTKLSGTAADLLAAVRAVESGEKPVATAFREPEPTPRRAVAPEPVARPQPVAAPAEASAALAPEAVAAVRAVLDEGGAPDTLAPGALAALGEGADDQLREDPWQLLRVAGVRPEQADGFARALLGAECRPDDERRGRAVTVWLLDQAALAGHTALDAPALTAALAQRAVPDPDAAVQSALAEGDALVFQDALDTAPPAQEEGAEESEERPVRVLIGLERYALAEESLADGLARVMNSVPKTDGSADGWEQAAASATRSAAELIRAVAGHGRGGHPRGGPRGGGRPRRPPPPPRARAPPRP